MEMYKVACVVLLLVVSLNTVYCGELQEAAKGFMSNVVDILDTFRRSVVISEEKGPHGEEGRGKALMKVALPLIAGFKIAGLILSALVSLKLLLLKSLAMSSLALVASFGLAAKYIYDKFSQPLHDTTPYYSGYGQNYQYWNYDPIWQAGSSLSYPSYDLGQSDVHSSTDLQGHYSEPIGQISKNSTARIHMARTPNKLGYKTTVYRTTIKRVDE